MKAWTQEDVFLSCTALEDNSAFLQYTKHVLKIPKNKCQFFSCLQAHPGSPKYQTFLPRNLSAQKMPFVPLAQRSSASS